MTGTLISRLQAHVERSPDKVFWRQISGGSATEVTFARFHARAASFASAYAERGVTPGCVVLIFLPQQPDAVAAFFGAMLIGAIPSFMPCPSAKQHPSIYWPGHEALLRRIGPHVLVSDRSNAAQMREHGIDGDDRRMLAIEDVGHYAAPPRFEADAEAVALLQHSSGTTSLKKGVALSHRAILLQADLYAARLGMTQADRVVSWLPLYHDMGLIACTVVPLALGQTVSCLDPFQWIARPVSLFDAIERYDGDFIWMPNFAFEHLVRAVPDEYRSDLSRVRAFINCSESCMANTFDRFAERFAKLGVRAEQLQVCYAMAETVFAVSQTAAGEGARAARIDLDRLHRDRVAADPAAGAQGARVLSTGRPLPGLDVRIQDEHARDLPDDAVGEVVLSGATLFSGYFNDPETTQARLRDGRYRTRDRGFMRDGELYVLGRQDDLMIVNGRNLHAHEVEALVSAVLGVKPGRAVAFGVFNEEVGSEDLVVVAERDASSVDDLVVSRAVRRAVYEQTNIEVKTCRIVDPGWLVKTTSGKISRAANREKHERETAPVAAASDRLRQPDSGALPRLSAFIEERFGQPPGSIRRETVAGDVEGWDSLAHSTLILAVEKTFGVRFADEEIFRFGCVGDLAERIDELLASADDHEPVADRVVHRSDIASIVRLGESEEPDIVVFAGREMFGKSELMDFASVFATTGAWSRTKFFVANPTHDWYVKCFDEVVAKLNALSDKPKILFGNSMGAYAALLFAPALRNVISVLALVPQSAAPRATLRASARPAEWWQVRLVSGIRYCVLYGEVEDEEEKSHMRLQLDDPERQRVIIVPNCGHNLASYLHKQHLLAPMLDCCVRPETMADEIEAIVSVIEPSAVALELRAVQLARRQAEKTGRLKQMITETGTRVMSEAGSVTGQTSAVETLEQRFAKANVTNDGRLTLEQAAQVMPGVAKQFDRIDAQQRGYVTIEEIRAFRRARAGKLTGGGEGGRAG